MKCLFCRGVGGCSTAMVGVVKLHGVREELRGTGIRVTLIEPGMVDTPFFDEQPDHALTDQDIAEAVLFSLSRPASVDVNEILVL